MRKLCKISEIIAAGIITVINLFHLIPQSYIEDWQRKGLFSIISLPKYFIPLFIICLSFFIAINQIFSILSQERKHTFKLGSNHFCKYFSSWYSKPGTVSIFCDSLEGWLTFENDNRILNALRSKSLQNQLFIFLRTPEPKFLIDDLTQKGAVIKITPTEIIRNYSFSSRNIMGNNSDIIIRDKQVDKSDKITFEELSNSYSLRLLNTIIEEELSK